MPGLSGTVEVKLYQQQLIQQRPLAALHALVGFHRALDNLLRGRAGRDAGAATADEGGGHLELRGTGVALGHALCKSQHGLAHGARQINGAQLALLTQASNDGRQRTRHVELVVGVRALVAEYLVRARGIGIQARRQ